MSSTVSSVSSERLECSFGVLAFYDDEDKAHKTQILLNNDFRKMSKEKKECVKKTFLRALETNFDVLIKLVENNGTEVVYQYYVPTNRDGTWTGNLHFSTDHKCIQDVWLMMLEKICKNIGGMNTPLQLNEKKKTFPNKISLQCTKVDDRVANMSRGVVIIAS